MKYCKYCGLPLEDGETCSCPESQAKSSGTQGAYGSGGGYAPYSGGYGRTGGAYNAGGLLDLVGTVFRAPYDAFSKAAGRASAVESFLYMAAQGLCAGLAAAVVIGQFNDLMYFFGARNGMGFSAFRAFIITLLLSIALSALTALVFHALARVLGSSLALSQSFSIVSVRSIPLAVVNLAACLLLFVNVGVAVIVFYAVGALVSACYLSAGALAAPGLNRNRSVYLSVLLVIVRVILMAVFIRLFSTLYLPEYMRSALDDASFLDILYELM